MTVWLALTLSVDTLLEYNWFYNAMLVSDVQQR